MAEFNVFAVYMLLIFVISLLGSTSKADLVQRDETMTVLLDLNDHPEYEIKYVQDYVDLTNVPNVGSSMNLIKNDSFAATPEGNTMSNATETPSEPTRDDQVTKSTTETTNTRTTTTMTNSTTFTSTSTPTSMSSTSTSSVTISTMSGTRN